MSVNWWQHPDTPLLRRRVVRQTAGVVCSWALFLGVVVRGLLPIASSLESAVRRLLPTLLLGLFVGLPAHAASRVVFMLADPQIQVVMDNAPLRPAGMPTKVTANHVSAGKHQVVVQRGSQELSRSTLEIPDGASVTVRVGPSGGLEVSGAPPATGAAPAAAAAPAAPPPSAAADPAAPASGRSAGGSALGAATVVNPEDDMSHSLDMNEGNGRGGAREGDGLGGDYQTFARATGATARVVGGVAAPRVTSGVGAAAPAVAHGATNLVRNAEAGGIDALRGSSNFRQGRPIPPKADTGTVVFVAPTDDPTIVYLEGFVIAQVGNGRAQARTKLEVGRHLLEFMDADTGQVVYKGVLTVDKDETTTLEVTDATPPKATDRTWAWSLR